MFVAEKSATTFGDVPDWSSNNTVLLLHWTPNEEGSYICLSDNTIYIVQTDIDGHIAYYVSLTLMVI